MSEIVWTKKLDRDEVLITGKSFGTLISNEKYVETRISYGGQSIGLYEDNKLHGIIREGSIHGPGLISQLADMILTFTRLKGVDNEQDYLE